MNQGSQGSIIVFIPVEYPLNTNYKKAIAYNIGVMAVKLPGYVFDIVVCNEKSESMDLLKEIEYYKAEHAIPNRVTVLEVHEKIYMSLFLYRYLYPYKIRDYSYLLVIRENVILNPLFDINTFIDFYTQSKLGILSPSVKTLELPFQYPSMVDMSASGNLGTMATLRNVSQVDIGFIMMSIAEYRKLYNVLATQVANQANGLEQSIYLTGMTIGIMDGFPLEVVSMTGSLSIAGNLSIASKGTIIKSNCMSINSGSMAFLEGIDIMNIPIGKSLTLKEDNMLSLYDLLSINMSVNSDMESQLSVSVGPGDICELFYLFEQFRNKPPSENALDSSRKKDLYDWYHGGYWWGRPWWWWRRYHHHYPYLFGDHYPYWEHASEHNIDALEDYVYSRDADVLKGKIQPPNSPISINSMSSTKGQMGWKPNKKMELEIGMEDGGTCMCVCMSKPYHSMYPLPCLLSIPAQTSVSEISIAETMEMSTQTMSLEKNASSKGLNKYGTTAWGFKGCHNFDAVVYDSTLKPMTVNVQSPYVIKL